MTTLAAGSSVTLSVGDGGYVSVATNGGMASVTVTPTGGSASTVNLGPLPVRQRFGPYSEGASIVLGNSTAVLDYDAGGCVFTFDQVLAVLAALPVTALWANRDALVTAGQYTAFFTNVGIGGGSVWTYSGGRWRPYGGRVRLKSLTTDVSNSAAPKVVMDYATLPAGIWQDGDTVEVSVIKDRTGGTADTDATDVMLGTVALTPGTTLLLSTSALATTQISMSLIYKYRRVSATSVRSQSVAGAVGFGNSTSANGLQTSISSLDSTETYLQVTSDLTTAGGEVVWLRGFTVDLIAGA